MSEGVDMINGWRMGNMMFGGGLVLLLVIAFLVLSIIALVKYIWGPR